MYNLFADQTILLGVTGSIACYKAADLASKLAQAGALVDVALTPAAAQFVAPLTFQSVTGRRAYVDADLWGSQGHVLHIGLARAARLVVIAPASANTLARLALGLADNLLCLTALAATCPLLLAPAMDGGMYTHPATQANLRILQERGARLIGPAEGRLASGLSSVGRMVEPSEILGHIRLALAEGGRLHGRKVIVTAGGTQEPLDPVRVLSNRSSGKQGFALAQAALDLGAQVTLISAPAALPTPVGARRVDVETAEEMLAAVLRALPGSDLLLMAAAVADFRPRSPTAHKIKKDGGVPQISLEKTPDILAAVAQARAQSGHPLRVVGFAAESQNLLDNAAVKLKAKKLDMIAANDISAQDAGFAVDANRITLLYPSGEVEALPLMEKSAAAGIILARAAELLSPIGA
ncbi:MAG: bifunctional phosphopantothenoylcysteine decarboxylase/phosphopantothenate--cysteine ligase CoaBC [Chloroflexi bacterium]|nr:bifunctional phosphopantothenoylcysteine decarboxylase/phosphopantothenate--cysteine ligase CoaBC [Chloroflexota bacterium]